MNWFLGTYLGISTFSAITFYSSIASIEKTLKSSGYEEVKKSSFSSNLKGYFKLLVFSFIPLLNIIISINAIIDASKGKKGKLYNQVIEEGCYKKTEERLKQEEEELLKKDRFEKAKDSFCGKARGYNDMTDVQKIEFLLKKRKELEENNSVVDSNDEYNAYENLTIEEKIEFLTEERNKILANYNELGKNFTPAKTKQKKMK